MYLLSPRYFLPFCTRGDLRSCFCCYPADTIWIVDRDGLFILRSDMHNCAYRGIQMDKNKELRLQEAVMAAGVSGGDGDRKKLFCAVALELASQYDCSPSVIVRICNQNGIKICKCQLGCF